MKQKKSNRTLLVKKVVQKSWKPENIKYIWPFGGLSSTPPLPSPAISSA
jgi:hypothetical protein